MSRFGLLGIDLPERICYLIHNRDTSRNEIHHVLSYGYDANGNMTWRVRT